MEKEKKNHLISAGGTLISMGIVLIFLLLCSFKQENPPPPAKKIIMVELEDYGGGGGGGGTPQQPTIGKNSLSENIVTDNSPNAPVINRPVSNKTNKTSETTTPKINHNAIFSGVGGGSGSGNGTGSGSGTGSGKGTGIGDGNGDGIGNGIGEGTGDRGYRKKPNIVIDVHEKGEVHVEVLVDANGNVTKARIIPGKTTITNTAIQNECLRRAKAAQYITGKEEFRHIIFRPQS